MTKKYKHKKFSITIRNIKARCMSKRKHKWNKLLENVPIVDFSGPYDVIQGR